MLRIFPECSESCCTTPRPRGLELRPREARNGHRTCVCVGTDLDASVFYVDFAMMRATMRTAESQESDGGVAVYPARVFAGTVGIVGILI